MTRKVLGFILRKCPQCGEEIAPPIFDKDEHRYEADCAFCRLIFRKYRHKGHVNRWYQISEDDIDEL